MTFDQGQKPVLTSFRVILKPHPAKIGDLSIAIPEVQNGAEGEVPSQKGAASRRQRYMPESVQVLIW